MLKTGFCLRSKTSIVVDDTAHRVPAEMETKETRRMNCRVETWATSKKCMVMTRMIARRRSLAAARLTLTVVAVVPRFSSTSGCTATKIPDINAKVIWARMSRERAVVT